VDLLQSLKLLKPRLFLLDHRSTERFSEAKESSSRLAIILMNDDCCQHTSPSSVLLSRYLAKEMRETQIMWIEPNGIYLTAKI
jgi:hypothetical protein